MGGTLLPEDIWQDLETFGLSQLGAGCGWYLAEGGQRGSSQGTPDSHRPHAHMVQLKTLSDEWAREGRI